jgi:predicted DNA-binding antitoxin AbrB/MazE fold protein
VRIRETAMATTITAVYENGVLRPLSPLELPEHSQVEIELRAVTEPATVQRELVRTALTRAGVLAEHQILLTPVQPMASEERAALAQRLADAGVAPLSAVVLDERAGR